MRGSSSGKLPEAASYLLSERDFTDSGQRALLSHGWAERTAAVHSSAQALLYCGLPLPNFPIVVVSMGSGRRIFTKRLEVTSQPKKSIQQGVCKPQRG
jgi:hypothetical protein